MVFRVDHVYAAVAIDDESPGLMKAPCFAAPGHVPLKVMEESQVTFSAA
jgi:hypothetical protein